MDKKEVLVLNDEGWKEYFLIDASQSDEIQDYGKKLVNEWYANRYNCQDKYDNQFDYMRKKLEKKFNIVPTLLNEIRL